MRVVLPFVFEQLKQDVLEKAGLSRITPSDCQTLACEISKTTKKQISDTTIKRIYGFAISNSVSSLYTLNLLSEYCGYESWDNYGSRKSRVPQLHVQTDVGGTQSIYEVFRKTTYNTLQALKNKSVIPFNLTIERQAINEHLDEFIAGNCRATVLTSPAGYGKTIGLCRWVEKQLTNSLIYNNDDTILFLNSKVLNSFSQGLALSDWLLALMGLPVGNGLEAIVNIDRLRDGNFYLVIDDFDGNTVKSEHLDMIFGMLLDFLAISGDWPGFKLILTMRATSWWNCERRLVLDNRIHEWHLGIMGQGNRDQNVPLFSVNEIKELSKRINPQLAMPEVLLPEISSFFSYPLFFQYYYQKNNVDFFLDEFDHFRVYEVISSYIFDKVYAGKFATEKVLLLRALLDIGEFKNGSFLIDKLKAYEYSKNFKDAYKDLISIGFLREVNYSEETNYAEYIEFTNKRLLTATMASKLMHDCGGLNAELCTRLVEHIAPPYRLYVLKWCIFNSVKAKQYQIFNHLNRISFQPADKAALLSFLSSLIKRNFLLPPGTKADEVFFDDDHQEIFNYFFGFEYISPEYEQGLSDLLKLDLKDTTKIWINVCLSVIYLIRLNSAGIERCINTLKQFPDDCFADFQINPLYCIESLYSFMKYGVVIKKALIQITRFLFSNAAQTPEDHLGSNNILYLLSVTTLRLSGNAAKRVRLVDKLKFLYKRNETTDHAYYFFLQVSHIGAFLDAGNISAGLKIYDEFLIEFKNSHLTYTPYMKMVFEMMSISVARFNPAIKYSKRAIEEIAYNQGKTTYKFIEMNTLSMYLDAQDFDRTNDLNKVAHLKLKKLMYSTGFNPQGFLFNYKSVRNHIIC